MLASHRSNRDIRLPEIVDKKRANDPLPHTLQASTGSSCSQIEMNASPAVEFRHSSDPQAERHVWRPPPRDAISSAGKLAAIRCEHRFPVDTWPPPDIPSKFPANESIVVQIAIIEFHIFDLDIMDGLKSQCSLVQYQLSSSKAARNNGSPKFQ